MVNPYNSPLAMQGKGGGKGAKRPKAAAEPKMPYRCPNWPSAGSERGPDRNSWKTAEKIDQFPKSEGI